MSIFSGKGGSILVLFRSQGNNIEGDHEFLDSSDFGFFGEIGTLENVFPVEFFRYYDNINVAFFGGRAPCLRTEDNYLGNI